MKKNNILFKRFKAGFTLTEILVVVIIIGILATLALPMLVKTLEKAKVGEAISNLNLIRTGQKIYFLEYGQFSPTIDDLNIESPNLALSRYFYYDLDGTVPVGANFKAQATRGGSGALIAPSPYQNDQYYIQKDGTVHGRFATNP
ncbi:MAG: prepilin-type N-terminal cleavage/methylation domain-containing protein [Candidatus Omnitrophica bacterium]|nr:prepilin-type N-terminal cleavage/methylation domain-containing protein [Candidatus Omnitrophota bacterium]